MGWCQPCREGNSQARSCALVLAPRTGGGMDGVQSHHQKLAAWERQPPGQSLDCRGGRKNVKLQCTGLRVPRATKKQAARPGRVSQPVTANGKLPEEAERKDCLPFPSFLPLSPLCLSSSRPSSLCAASSGVGGCRGAGWRAEHPSPGCCSHSSEQLYYSPRCWNPSLTPHCALQQPCKRKVNSGENIR